MAAVTAKRKRSVNKDNQVDVLATHDEVKHSPDDKQQVKSNRRLTRSLTQLLSHASESKEEKEESEEAKIIRLLVHNVSEAFECPEKLPYVARLQYQKSPIQTAATGGSEEKEEEEWLDFDYCLLLDVNSQLPTEASEKDCYWQFNGLNGHGKSFTYIIDRVSAGTPYATRLPWSSHWVLIKQFSMNFVIRRVRIVDGQQQQLLHTTITEAGLFGELAEELKLPAPGTLANKPSSIALVPHKTVVQIMDTISGSVEGLVECKEGSEHPQLRAAYRFFVHAFLVGLKDSPVPSHRIRIDRVELHYDRTRNTAFQAYLDTLMRHQKLRGCPSWISGLESGCDQKLLWHGGSRAAIRCIATTGFEVAFSKRRLHGEGNYFSSYSGLALKYSREADLAVNRHRVRHKVICARVVVAGAKEHVEESTTPTTPKPRPIWLEAYQDVPALPAHTLVDKADDPAIYSIWKNEACLPQATLHITILR